MSNDVKMAGTRPTVRSLAQQLIENDEDLETAIVKRDEKKAEWQKFQFEMDERETRVDALCRQRNLILQELSKFEMIEYEGEARSDR